MVFYGPWTQPPDRDGTTETRGGNQQSITQVFGGSTYPAFPPSGATPDDPVARPVSAGWDITARADPTNTTIATYQWTLTQWVLAVDVQWQIDNIPYAVMPPVSPGSPDPHVIGVEYESTAGAPLGPVTIRLSDVPVLSGHVFPDVTSTPPAAQAPDDAAMELHQLAAAGYTWDRSGLPKPLLPAWLAGPDVAAAPFIVSVDANPGGTLVPNFHGAPTDTWFGSSVAGEPGNDLGVFDIVTDLASLDGGDFAVVAAISNFVSESAPALPTYIDSGGTARTGRQIVGWSFALDSETIGAPVITALVHYRPPRYRYVYDVPPPQRQFPRDDGLGISTRRSWPPPTSKQFGQRRGPAATYQ